MKITAPGNAPSPAEMVNPKPEAAPAPAGFGRVLEQSVQKVNELQQEADRKAVAHLTQGEGDVHDVMLAMEKAGLAFKLLVQGRNKLIQAYEELNRIQM